MINPADGPGDLGAFLSLCASLLNIASRLSAASAKNGMRSGRSDQAYTSNATSMIPIVSVVGQDPAATGLVASFSKQIFLSACFIALGAVAATALFGGAGNAAPAVRPAPAP